MWVSTRVWHFYRKTDQTYWTKPVSANLLRDKRGWVTSWMSENWLSRSSADLMECDPCMPTTCSKKGWQFSTRVRFFKGLQSYWVGYEEYKLGMGTFSGMIFGAKWGWYFNPQLNICIYYLFFIWIFCYVTAVSITPTKFYILHIIFYIELNNIKNLSLGQKFCSFYSLF